MLDPDVAQLLAESGAARPQETATLEQARAAIRVVVALQGEGVEMASIQDIAVAGEGGPVTTRLYRPHGLSGAAPVLMWAHAGGFTRGDLDTWDTPLTCLADRVGAVVASVDYRLAPETRFPGAVDDMLAVLRQLGRHAGPLGLDSDRIAIGGDSAGGTLAASAALAARDLGIGPALVAQVLIHPPLDPDCASKSARQYANGFALTREAVVQGWQHYLPTPYAADHPYAAPLRARNLDGLPPAIIATAEFDPVRDEGEEYGRRLAAAGNTVRLRRFDGMIHSFLHHNGRVPASRTLPAWLASELGPFLGQ